MYKYKGVIVSLNFRSTKYVSMTDHFSIMQFFSKNPANAMVRRIFGSGLKRVAKTFFTLRTRGV